MYDERTTTQSLKLPHPSNTLSDDVVRLREALQQIDNLFNWSILRLSCDDPARDSLQEVADELEQLDVLTATISPSDTLSVTYDQSGRIESIIEELPGGKPRATHYYYNQDNTVSEEVVAVGGRVFTSTYSYDNGLLSGITRSIS